MGIEIIKHAPRRRNRGFAPRKVAMKTKSFFMKIRWHAWKQKAEMLKTLCFLRHSGPRRRNPEQPRPVAPDKNEGFCVANIKNAPRCRNRGLVHEYAMICNGFVQKYVMIFWSRKGKIYKKHMFYKAKWAKATKNEHSCTLWRGSKMTTKN